jgi:hypothetical protein
MEKIEVTVRRDTKTGAFTPTSFIWKGKVYIVDSVGRRWQADDGEHILVLTLPEKYAFELVYSVGDGSWGLVRGHDRPTVRTV